MGKHHCAHVFLIVFSYGPFNGESLVKVGYRSSKMKHKPLWPAIRPFTKTSKYRFCVLRTAILLPHVIPTEGYGCRTFTKKLCTQSGIAPMGWPSPKEFFQPLLHTVYTISITELAFTTPSSTEQRKKPLLLPLYWLFNRDSYDGYNMDIINPITKGSITHWILVG